MKNKWSFTIVPKKIKINIFTPKLNFGIILTKYVQDLYPENYKMLLRGSRKTYIGGVKYHFNGLEDKHSKDDSSAQVDLYI